MRARAPAFPDCRGLEAGLRYYAASLSPSLRRISCDACTRLRVHGALLTHKLDESFYVFERGFRQNSVAQIEDVPGPAAGLTQNRRRARAQLLLPGEEQDGIEIALHCPLKLQATPRLIEREAPVNSNNLGAGLFHRRQEGGRIRTEIDNGDFRGPQPSHQIGGKG